MGLEMGQVLYIFIVQHNPMGFTNGLFDFGPAVITAVSPVQSSPYYSSGSILYANMATLNSVTLTRNGSSTYKVKFSNNTNDDCSQSNVSLDAYRTTFLFRLFVG